MRIDDMDYLRAIQIGGPIAERIDEVMEEYTWLVPEPIERLFVSDQVNSDTDDRLFTSLWAFTEHYILEAKQFLTQFDLDIAPYSTVQYLDVKFEEFSFHSAKTRKASRLALRFRMAGGVGGGGRSISPIPSSELFSLGPQSSLSATGKNCTFLATIIKEIFLPRLEEATAIQDQLRRS